MYEKNNSSPASVYAKVVKATDGSAITSGVVAFHIRAGTRQAVAGTAATHIANGVWRYTPTQAESNYDAFAIEFYHAEAVAGGPLVEIFTTDATIDGRPQSQVFAMLLAAASGKTSVDEVAGTVVFYLDDGATEAFTITYGTVPGQRTARAVP